MSGMLDEGLWQIGARPFHPYAGLGQDIEGLGAADHDPGLGEHLDSRKKDPLALVCRQKSHATAGVDRITLVHEPLAICGFIIDSIVGHLHVGWER
jgi:hypothetical protein